MQKICIKSNQCWIGSRFGYFPRTTNTTVEIQIKFQELVRELCNKWNFRYWEVTTDSFGIPVTYTEVDSSKQSLLEYILFNYYHNKFYKDC